MMQYLVYFLCKLLMGCVALLPFKILFYFSRCIYFVLYRILNYRRDVVELNLMYALPDWVQDKFEVIEKNYYKHLSELIVEIIKGFYLPLEEILKRVLLSDDSMKVIEKIQKENRHIVLMLGHYGNWEWPLYIIQKFISLPVFVMYSPLHSKPLDKWIKKKRERFGAKLIDNQQVHHHLRNIRSQKSIITIVGDQSPTGRKRITNTRFLALDTPFYTGGEYFAQLLVARVVYVHIHKKGFGKYVIDLEIITEKPSENTEQDITLKYVQLLEKDITDQPAYWIWSHKRWKGTIPY